MMNLTAQKSTRDSGSIFIETLIASAIVALMLAATYRSIGDASLRTKKAEERREALLVAQSQMATAGITQSLSTGGTSGIDGEMAWQLDVAPYVFASDENDVGQMERVRVTVRRRDADQDLITLSSLRLLPKRVAQ